MGFWSDAGRREAARARFEQRMAIPVLIAAVLLAAVTAVLLFADVSGRARTALIVVDGLLWAFFVVDYLVRFTLAIPKKRFLREEWVDGVLALLPLFQPLRVAGAVLRVTRLGAAVRRTESSARQLVGRHKLYLVLGWASGLVLMASTIVPIVEPDTSKITTFGDGLWWAIVTTTTVGYGDLVPESATGRVIALVLMLVGISLIGMITANLASLFLSPQAAGNDAERSSAESEEASTADETPQTTSTELRSLEERLATIEHKLDALAEQLSG
jgi:voltage-gated potassium channel